VWPAVLVAVIAGPVTAGVAWLASRSSRKPAQLAQFYTQLAEDNERWRAESAKFYDRLNATEEKVRECEERDAEKGRQIDRMRRQIEQLLHRLESA
jgi:uncharacterized protein HemX